MFLCKYSNTKSIKYILCFSEQVVCYEERIEHCCRGLLQHLENLNLSKQQMVTGQLQKATDNLAANLRYQFLDPNGPRRRDITKKQPLFSRYVQFNKYL